MGMVQSGGVWVARNVDASALYVFGSEIAALRFVNREGYYMEVLCVPHGEDALRWTPPRETPAAKVHRSA